MRSRYVSFASTPEVRARMQQQGRRDTDLELALRRELYRRRLRYRVQVPVLHRRTADVVFLGPKVIVDVRSCFWHACPEHGCVPRSNSDWWAAKLAKNAARDEATVARLREVGWTVVVVWGHDDLGAAADKIATLVRTRSQQSKGRKY
jgi:DNA mismatch endonuclease, patch repair protein